MLHLLKEENLTDLIEVDSAGTAAYHVGEPADARSRKTAERRGVPLPSIARAFTPEDFVLFDYILAMDSENYENLLALASCDADRSKVHMMRSFDPASDPGASVPDPYYGGDGGFEDVFDICQEACKGLLAHVRATRELQR